MNGIPEVGPILNDFLYNKEKTFISDESFKIDENSKTKLESWKSEYDDDSWEYWKEFIKNQKDSIDEVIYYKIYRKKN